ncbi:MAG: rhodanese-like domain-containing protein [Pseudomonadota bacterium]
MKESRRSVLIDVRTRAEWGFVGLPDLGEIGKAPLCVEWASFPSMSRTPRFAEAVIAELGDSDPDVLLLICRSGARSLLAAEAVANLFASRGRDVLCLNVTEGFEGDLNAAGHRGMTGGWKARGLAWRQS